MTMRRITRIAVAAAAIWLSPCGVDCPEDTRECITEALAEKVDRGELREDDAKRIATQILRENALKLFPRLRAALPK